MKYADFTPRLAPPFLAGPRAQAFLRSFGQMCDDHVSRTKQAVLARMPLLAPPDALEALGRDRVMPRGPGESNPAYAGRLANAMQAYGWSGTPTGLLKYALAPGGWPGAAIIVNQQWEAPAGVDFHKYGPGYGGVPPDGDTSKWARFWLVIPGTSYGAPARYGDGNTYGDGILYGTGAAPASDVARLEQIVRQWSPARCECVGAFIVLPVTPGGAPCDNTATVADSVPSSSPWSEENLTFGGAACAFWRFTSTVPLT